MAEKEGELQSLLMKVKEESEKVGLKLIQKRGSWHLVPLPMADRWGTIEAVTDLIFWGFKIHCRW